MGAPPSGAKAFFVGDQLGGTGWEIELPDKTIEKYYVDFPAEFGEVSQYFIHFRDEKEPRLKEFSVEALSQKFINQLRLVVSERTNIFCTSPKLHRITGLSIRTNNLRVWMAAHTPASHYYGAENEFVRRETQTVWINRGFLAGWVAMACFLSLSSMFVRE